MADILEHLTATITYFDENMKETTKDKAVHVIIGWFAGDELIREDFGSADPNVDYEKYVPPDENEQTE